LPFTALPLAVTPYAASHRSTPVDYPRSYGFTPPATHGSYTALRGLLLPSTTSSLVTCYRSRQDYTAVHYRLPAVQFCTYPTTCGCVLAAAPTACRTLRTAWFTVPGRLRLPHRLRLPLTLRLPRSTVIPACLRSYGFWTTHHLHCSTRFCAFALDSAHYHLDCGCTHRAYRKPALRLTYAVRFGLHTVLVGGAATHHRTLSILLPHTGHLHSAFWTFWFSCTRLTYRSAYASDFFAPPRTALLRYRVTFTCRFYIPGYAFTLPGSLPVTAFPSTFWFWLLGSYRSMRFGYATHATRAPLHVRFCCTRCGYSSPATLPFATRTYAPFAYGSPAARFLPFWSYLDGWFGSTTTFPFAFATRVLPVPCRFV